jgi:hypothetical protein
LARSILYILFGEESLRAQSVRVGGRPGLVSERPPLRESPHGKRTLFATLPAMTAVSMCSWRILIIKPRLGDEPGRSAVGGGRLSSYWKFTNLPRRLTPQTVDATLRWLAPLLYYLVGNFLMARSRERRRLATKGAPQNAAVRYQTLLLAPSTTTAPRWLTASRTARAAP